MRQSQVIIPRPSLQDQVLRSLSESTITVLLGARQTGKTTLANILVKALGTNGDRPIHLFDLERASTRAALSTPELTLEPLTGTIVIDEFQRIPELFETLRPLADRPGTPAQFLLLGSASPGLVKGVSESLAGRALFIPVPGFSIEECGHHLQDRLWTRGTFPRSFLADSESASRRWREAFVSTFLERDIPQLGIRVPSEALRRFWTMLAHYHSQIWNASELARSLGTTFKTAQHYRDILAGGYVIRVLHPWFENLKKRQVKSPKVYIRDSGLLHTLLGINDMVGLRSHPGYGGSWEGFALEQAFTILGPSQAYFWSTQRGAELDLMIFRQNKRFGFEFKCSDAPRMTKSMHVAIQDLGLARLYVVYPGGSRYPLHEKAEALPLVDLAGLSDQDHM